MSEHEPAPASEGLAEVLARALHNEGDGGIWEHFDRRNAEVVASTLAEVIARDWLPGVIRAAEARALREAAEEVWHGQDDFVSVAGSVTAPTDWSAANDPLAVHAIDLDDDALLPRVLEVLGRSLAGLVMEGLDAWIFAGTGAETP